MGGGVPYNTEDVEVVSDRCCNEGVGVNDYNVVFFAKQLLGNRTANLTSTNNNNFHIIHPFSQ